MGSMTLDKLVLKVAEKLSVADYRTDGTPYIPADDAFNLHKCAEMVDRGIRLILDAAPPEGWRWEKRIASVTFDADGTGTNNINSDAARYMLPTDFGGEVLGKIHYTSDSNHSTRIVWRDEAFIRERRATVVHTGYPQYAAVRAYQPTSTTIDSGRRWELIVDPQPSAADTVEFPYRLCFDGVRLVGGSADSADSTTVVDSDLSIYPDDYFNGWTVEILSGTGRGSYATVTDFTSSTGTVTVADWLDVSGGAGGTDPESSSVFLLKPAHPYYHPMGFSFDGIAEIACLAACEMYAGDMNFDSHNTELFYNRKIVEAYRVNGRQATRRLGRITDGIATSRERTWSDVTTDHDV